MVPVPLPKLAQATATGKSDHLFSFLPIRDDPECFGLGSLQHDKPDLKTTLGQIQVNAMNFWMDKLRTLPSTQLESALLALPENWWLPNICRTDLCLSSSYHSQWGFYMFKSESESGF